MSSNNSIIRAGFTLVELLVVVAVISVLMGVLLPSLSSSRDAARTVQCASNQRQMFAAWQMYAGDANGRVMPLAYWSAQDIGAGPAIYWWGAQGTASTSVDHSRGFLSAYLDASLRPESVYECPSQPWGTYRPQGTAKSITSTYGYNGYYLSPAKTPGWGPTISRRPWQRLDTIRRPSELFVFADTLLPSSGSSQPSNNALLDPPLLWSSSGGGRWTVNPSPTTAFRHGRGSSTSRVGSVVAACADGHVAPVQAHAAWLTQPMQGVGSVGGNAVNGPQYVPDSAEWR